MTRFDPSLIVKRLRVERNERCVYDEAFHVGVNVVRGENSSGKSTVLNFIFYGLGGDLTDWSEAALLCSRVVIEVELSGKTATFSRDLSVKPGQPMDIFGGSMDAAIKAPHAEWSRYPYKRSTTRESFSQAVFRLLHMPEVSSDVTGTVTMHQILRLLYSDQLSPVEHIFKFESFDPPILRDAVGRLLCGAYDNRLYENEVRLRGLTKEFENVSAELRSLLSVLGRAQESMTLDWIAAQRATLIAKQNSVKEEIVTVEKRGFSARAEDQLTLEAQNLAYVDVQNLQASLAQAQEKLDAIAFNIADSSAFIASLEHKLKALNDSESIADYVGEIRFESCPVCFAAVGDPDKDTCHLCKTPFEKERAKHRIVALINDTALQLKQSRSLQEMREREQQALRKELDALNKMWRVASARFNELRTLPSTEIQDSLRALQRQAGYLEREAEDLESRASIAQLVEQLSARKAEINGAMTKIKSDNDALRSGQEVRLLTAYTEIAEEVRELLHNDLRRQDSFENARSVQFDFAANSLSVDGHSYFSASSRVILKSSFFAGFLAAASKDAKFRHPRFCMIDTIEDKGMEPQRSQNFQLQLYRISQEAKVDHQIIFATAMIVPDLDEQQFTVGKFSTRDDFTLAIDG